MQNYFIILASGFEGLLQLKCYEDPALIKQLLPCQWKIVAFIKIHQRSYTLSD